jgi:hypothetical protein
LRAPVAQWVEHSGLYDHDRSSPRAEASRFSRTWVAAEFVEDTTERRRHSDPQLVLQIADCTNTVNLEFSLETPQLRENSLFKVDTLLGALCRFRDGLAAEVELAAERQRRQR